ncbi:MAG: hypothetical protein CL456_06480 [Acidimicrobiaceae bacterium]|nr:hypothetical protein [Acidimicrobiaceae bacterium]
MTMDWIVTTGSTVEAAVDTALDELSVTQEDIEFEILRNPKSSLFGFRRNQAQVRARVRPMEPPAKREWRRPTKSDKRKKVKKQSQNAKTRSTQEGNKKRPQAAGSNQNKKMGKGRRKEDRPATNGPSHKNSQAREASSIRKRTINVSPQSSNARSIDKQDEAPQPEPPKVRRTRKINH